MSIKINLIILKKEEEIINSFRKKVLKKELFQENNNINEKNKEYNVNTAKSFKVEDMYEILQKKKQRELDSLKAKQEEDILQECTFQPNSKTKPVDKKELTKNIEKLYLEGKESYMKKMKQEEKDLDLNSENEKNCTFKPVIKDYKGNYFENNPLKEDALFNTEIRKMEKNRNKYGTNFRKNFDNDNESGESGGENSPEESEDSEGELDNEIVRDKFINTLLELKDEKETKKLIENKNPIFTDDDFKQKREKIHKKEENEKIEYGIKDALLDNNNDNSENKNENNSDSENNIYSVNYKPKKIEEDQTEKNAFISAANKEDNDSENSDENGDDFFDNGL